MKRGRYQAHRRAHRAGLFVAARAGPARGGCLCLSVTWQLTCFGLCRSTLRRSPRCGATSRGKCEVSAPQKVTPLQGSLPPGWWASSQQPSAARREGVASAMADGHSESRNKLLPCHWGRRWSHPLPHSWPRPVTRAGVAIQSFPWLLA